MLIYAALLQGNLCCKFAHFAHKNPGLKMIWHNKWQIWGITAALDVYLNDGEVLVWGRMKFLLKIIENWKSLCAVEWWWLMADFIELFLLQRKSALRQNILNSIPQWMNEWRWDEEISSQSYFLVNSCAVIIVWTGSVDVSIFENLESWMLLPPPLPPVSLSLLK